MSTQTDETKRHLEDNERMLLLSRFHRAANKVLDPRAHNSEALRRAADLELEKVNNEYLEYCKHCHDLEG